MKFKPVLLTLALGSFAYSSNSSAQIFKLNFAPAANLDPVTTAVINAELDKIEKDINEDLPSAETPDRLMEGMANSSVMAGKGIGSDYASGMEVALLGFGVGAGADMEKNKEAKSDFSGLGLQTGIVLGTNLGRWIDATHVAGLEAKKLNVFINYMSIGRDIDSGDTKAKIDSTSFGIHANYDWIKGNGSKLFGWGGVKIHTGYEYNKTELDFTSKIEKKLNATSAGATLSSDIIANPFASIDVATHSIPIEISSSIRFLYLFSLYGGLGMDYNIGSAEGKGDLNSPSSTVQCTGECPTGTNVGQVETEANIDGDGKVNPFLFRGFAGLQLNLPYVRIYGQVDKALGNDLIGATAGVRFVY